MNPIAPSSPIKRSKSTLGIISVLFIASKATAFLAPMMLARALPVASYGSIELALAWGTPGAVLVGLGLNGAVPYFLLKLNRPDTRQVYFLHVTGVSLLLGIAAVILHLPVFPQVIALALMVAGIFAAQNIYAALLKTENQPALSSFMEVGIYCVLFVVAVVFALIRLPITMSWIYALLLSLMIICVLASAMLFLRDRDDASLVSAYKDTVGFGVPLILTSLLATLLMTGGRILIGAFLGVTDVAIFSILFRMAAAAVLVHQLPITIVFPRIYTAGSAQLNRFLGLIQAAVLAAALSVWVIGWPIGLRLFPILRQNRPLIHSIMLVVALQMFYWCAAAECEFILYRENRSKHYAVWLSCGSVLLIAGTYALKLTGHISLLSMSQWVMAVMYVIAIGNMTLLWKVGIRLTIPMIISTAAFGGYWFAQGVGAAFVLRH